MPASHWQIVVEKPSGDLTCYGDSQLDNLRTVIAWMNEYGDNHGVTPLGVFDSQVAAYLAIEGRFPDGLPHVIVYAHGIR